MMMQYALHGCSIGELQSMTSSYQNNNTITIDIVINIKSFLRKTTTYITLLIC